MHKPSRVSSAGRLTDQEATLRDLAGRGLEGTTSPFFASYNLLEVVSVPMPGRSTVLQEPA